LKNTDYEYKEPYYIKSGENKGKCLELLMFKKFLLIKWIYDKIKEKKSKNKNEFEKRLDFLFTSIANKKTTLDCPFCQNTKVTRFSAPGTDHNGFSISCLFTCCEDDSCKEKLIGMAGERIPYFFPLTFFSITMFMYRADQKKVINLLKISYGLPKKLNDQIAFRFFFPA
jgi:hypothetical protein